MLFDRSALFSRRALARTCAASSTWQRSHAALNQPHRERVRAAGRAGGIVSVLVVGALSCLPSDDLSSFSNGQRPLPPPEGLPGDPSLETPAEGSLATDEAARSAVTPSAAPGADCGSECVTPGLAIEPEQAPGAGSSGDRAAAAAVDGGLAEGSETEPPEADASVPATTSAADAGASRCVPGSIVGPDQRCFELVMEPNSWAAARTRCQSNGPGWDLTTIRSATRNAWLSSVLGSLSEAWVGASDSPTEGEWHWLDDSTAFWNGTGTTGSAVGDAYESWTDGAAPEPNGGVNSDCLRLLPGGDWADFRCPAGLPSICEGPQL